MMSLLVNRLEGLSLPRNIDLVKPSILSCLLGWFYLKAHFTCHDIPMLGRRGIILIMTTAVKLEIKQQSTHVKQFNKNTNKTFQGSPPLSE